MGYSTRPSEARLRTILDRQSSPGFGKNYIPSILANTAEAPKISRPVQVRWKKIGRHVHLLSNAEMKAFLLGIYHPDVWEIHEQRMLPCAPAAHPLALHERGKGRNLPPLQGTLHVANQMGLLKFHPRIHYGYQPDGSSQTAAFPFIGDLLFFRNEKDGPTCLNWSIKSTANEFSHALNDIRRKGRALGEASQKVLARQAIEERLYADAGIKTVQVAANLIDDVLVANLARLHLWHDLEIPLQLNEIQEIEGEFTAAITLRRPANECIFSLMSEYRCSDEVIKAILCQMIWNRRLRVDLFKPILLERPLNPETKDVLIEYRHWYSGDTQ